MNDETDADIEIVEIPGNYSDSIAQRLDAFGILAIRLDKVTDPEAKAIGAKIMEAAFKSIPTAEAAKLSRVK